MSEQNVKIDIQTEIERFFEHLNFEDNEHIVFSGAFGIGKTYFLNQFFKEIKKDEFECFYLTPVNYSIASNEDIFEYIKYDIVFELLKKDMEFYKNNISQFVFASTYIKENWKEIALKLTVGGLKTNNSIGSIVKIFENLASKFKNIEKTHTTDEKIDIVNFLKNETNKTGSIYEEDYISQLISKLVESFNKINIPSKKTVLVIDDLDRIDPEHIFRLLNVFSAHTNFQQTGKHKFGFDKIILVFDIENIRSIFKHKYGCNADFSGYIDKFYSKDVFCFDNKRATIDTVVYILRNNNWSLNDRVNFIEDKYAAACAIQPFMEILVYSDAINLRSLLKNVGKTYKCEKAPIAGFFDCSTTNSYDCFALFEFMVFLSGSISNFEDSIEKLKKNYSSINLKNIHNSFLTVLIGLADIENHKCMQGKHKYIINGNTFIYEIIPSRNEDPNAYIDTESEKKKLLEYIPQIISDAFSNYKKYINK